MSKKKNRPKVKRVNKADVKTAREEFQTLLNQEKPITIEEVHQLVMSTSWMLTAVIEELGLDVNELVARARELHDIRLIALRTE